MRRTWSRLERLAALAIVVVALTGCTPLLAIDQRSLVMAVALDRAPCGIRATGQWYSSAPSLMISGKMGPQTESACGATADAAVSALRREAHRYLDFGITNLILLGRPLAETDPNRTLDLLWREGDLPESADVAVADGEARSLLFPASKENAFLLYTRLTDAYLTNMATTPIPLWRFVARRHGLPGDAWAPMLETSGAGARSVGVAAFRGGRMVAVLRGSQAAAFGWLTKQGGYSDLDVSLSVPTAVPLAFRVVRSRLRRSCAGPAPALALTLYTRLRQGEGVRLRGRDPSDLSRQAALAAWRDTAAAVRTLVDAGADPLGLRSSGCPGTSLARPVRTVGLTVHVRVRPDEREA